MSMESGPDFSDGFDRLPDPILLLILNEVSDIKTLLRCRSVSKRFNSLVPQADSLLLRVDRVISGSDSGDEDSFLSTLFKTLIQLIQFSPEEEEELPENPTRLPNSPSRILSAFTGVKSLRIELPSGDLNLDKGISVKWVARFGKTLNSCVILGFGCSGGLKMRVVWTISALIASSARHYMVNEIVKEQKRITHLIVSDRDNEGLVVMDKEGLIESRDCRFDDGDCEIGNRTVVPAVRMRMRHEAKLELDGGVVMEGATLVVVRRSEDVMMESDDVGLAAEAFGREGVFAEAVEKLMKRRSYVLEMNSF